MTIDFWSGNRTTARQLYERDILFAILSATREEYGSWKVIESTKDYTDIEESNIFDEFQHDLTVTVAGNVKFENREKIVINKPIMKGLLGFRIIIINEEDQTTFSKATNARTLKNLRHGIPLTWADAELFRSNGFSVVEEGYFDGLFDDLRNRKFDYTAFGANEVHDVFQERAAQIEGLKIEDRIVIYYPFPLLFYINTNNKQLAERVKRGLEHITENGTLDNIFDKHFRETLDSINFNSRVVIELENPKLPVELKEFKSGLFSFENGH
ncbi:type 2 periplasmic-binding domain-containing protein [Alkalitalea saponilacus]|uniref:Extracellular solute-binding protein, family 3 n=1 Tax=Alkalitalea saponilacus TaxID=889453 RepID=A0A1T5HS91_9BACT|nr:transporter substrate-binding domain-containing protein [Alkalitalea saponilacus]SKC23556.1 extracellular solute-binding protein, family 3 [Alkalitalea saponilacus]